MPMPGVFPDKSPDDIGADLADKERAAEEAGRDDDDDPHLQKPDNTTHPLNPSPERNSQIIAERDERPGS